MLYESMRHELFKTVLKLYQKDLIQLNMGNVSIRVSHEHFIITPTGVPYDEMMEDDLVVVGLDGSLVEGRRKPSSEMPMHAIVYKNMPAIKAAVHTHSVFALAFAVAGKGIPIISTEGLAVRGPVPVAAYACAGTEAQGIAAVEAMKGPPPVSGVLLKNHGVLAVGISLSDAYATASKIETAAKVYFLALQIGNPDTLTDEQIKEIRDVYISKKA